MINRLRDIKNHPHWILAIFGTFSSIVTFSLPMILVRILPIKDFGLYKSFFTLLMFIPFIIMAGGPLNSIYYWVNLSENRSSVIKANYSIQIIFGTIFLLISSFVLLNLTLYDEFNTKTKFYLIVIGILSCPTAYFSEFLIAKGNVIKGCLLYLFFDISKVIGLIYTAHSYGLNTLFTFYFFFNLACFIISTFLGKKYGIIGLEFTKKDLKQALSYALPISISAFIFYSIERVDHLFLIHFFSTEEYALYSVGCLIFPPIIIIETSFQKHLIPRLTRLFQENDLTGVNHILQWYMMRVSSIVIPISIFTFCYSEEIISFLYGESFTSAAQFLRIFSVTYLLPIIPYDSIQRATNKTKSVLISATKILTLYLFIVFLLGTNLNETYILFLSVTSKVLVRIFVYYKGVSLVKVSLTTPTKEMMFFIISSLASILLVSSIEYLFNSIMVIGCIYCISYSLIFCIHKRRCFIKD